MSLQVLTTINNVSAAFHEFVRHFETEGELLERDAPIPGGSESTMVRWYPELKFWVMLQPDRHEARHWCAFGVDDPNENAALPIVCELNPPHEGIDRRCNAVFVRSNNGTIYLAHSGRITGGRVGAGKTSFLDTYGNETVDIVTWPGGVTSDYIIIGALDDDALRALVAEFVHKVAQYKEKAAAEKALSKSGASSAR